MAIQVVVQAYLLAKKKKKKKEVAAFPIQHKALKCMARSPQEPVP